VKERGLAQINDRELLRSIVSTVLSNNPQILADYQSGKKNAAKTVIGQAMKQTGGRANPILLGELVEEELNQ
jgi:aspartyl-tRNA(Asn)/glutamyl-tRNA(Gln) amidotransferase subunit B